VHAEVPAGQAERAKLLRELLEDAAGHPEAGTKADLQYRLNGQRRPTK